MAMAFDGISKLIEECGELQQVLAKRLAYWTVDEHPDGSNLPERLADEVGDVLAAITFVVAAHGLDKARVNRQAVDKLEVFLRWDADPTNHATLADLREQQPRA